MLIRLKHSIQALAIPAGSQLNLFPDFAAKTDELALDFDHWLLCCLDNNMIDNQEAITLLKELDQYFNDISGESNADLWTEQELKNRNEWEFVREKAKAILVVFGWDLENPPDYKHEYVKA